MEEVDYLLLGAKYVMWVHKPHDKARSLFHTKNFMSQCN